MKCTEDQIVSQITLDLSSDSSMPAKQNAGAAYANWFYANHNHGVENQRICISKIASVLGLDFDTAVRIQAPILAAYSAAHIIGIANEAIFSQHAQVSRQISNHLVDKAVQHAEEQKEAKSAHQVYAAQAAESHRSVQAVQTPKEAYEAKVDIANYQSLAREKVTTATIYQVAKNPNTVQQCEKRLVEVQQAVQENCQKQADHTQQAKKYLAPTNLPAWHLMPENSKAQALRNEAIAIKNTALYATKAKQLNAWLAEVKMELQLTQEDEEINSSGESDTAKAVKSLALGQKFHTFYVARVAEMLVLETPPDGVAGANARARKWEYVIKAREAVKVEADRYAAYEVDRVAHEGTAIKAIQSFATAEKQWILLNKPAPQNEFDFFYSSIGWFPRADFTTITKLNLSNSGMRDHNAYTLASTMTVLPNLKYLDVSGNQITATGEEYFAKVMQDPTVQRIVIILQNLSKHAKLQSGNKEDVVSALRDILKRAEDRGVDVKNIVVDTGFITWVKNVKGMLNEAHSGFIKCHWLEDPIGDYAKNDLFAKLPKKNRDVFEKSN